MRPGRRSVGVALLTVMAALLLSGCTADITRDKVQHTFGVTFRRLYIHQLHLLGKPLPPSLLRQVGHTRQLREVGFYTQAHCRRGARHSPQTGAGDDWTCIQYFQRHNGTIAEADYEVSVRTDGCLVATGPAQVVGPPQMTAADGRTVTNPLAQFYACFNT